MITDKELQELVDFESQEAPVLSLYLNVDPTQRTRDEYRLSLRNLLKKAEAEADSEDIAEVTKYFDFQYNWQGKGVAVFSCQRESFWRAYSLPVPVDDGVFVSSKPYIRPLTHIFDEYQRYGVVLVGREGARLFIFNLGQLEETQGTMGQTPKRHKQGGWAASRHQRHEDEIAHRNLRDAVELTAKFCEEGKCKYLVLGGTDDNLALFQGMLPKAVRERVVGTFSIDTAAPENEVLDRSLPVIHEAIRRRKEALVEQLITAAKSKGGVAALGLDDALQAVEEGRALIVLLAEGFAAKAYRCDNCGYLSAQQQEQCAFCGGTMVEIEDAVDAAARRSIELGVTVEVVKDNPALAEAGMGAILRY